MPVRYTDEQIDTLVREVKSLPGDYRAKLQQLKPKHGHKERQLDVQGVEGGQFRIILRQSEVNVLDFSVILSYLVPQSNQQFRLRRYNGRHGEHTNRIERDRFYGFHIHKATARYQELGADEDAFADITDRYSNLDGALRCLVADCGFQAPPEAQLPLMGDERQW